MSWVYQRDMIIDKFVFSRECMDNKTYIILIHPNYSYQHVPMTLEPKILHLIGM